MTTVVNENISVCVRVRPLSSRELENGSENAWILNRQNNTLTQRWTANQYKNLKCDSKPSLRANDNLLTFHCGILYDESSTTEQIYNNQLKTLVDSTLNGVNATICCYGQTSSG